MECKQSVPQPLGETAIFIDRFAALNAARCLSTSRCSAGQRRHLNSALYTENACGKGNYILLCPTTITFTRHTLLWQGSLLSLLSVRFFGYTYLGDSGTDRREILHEGTRVPDVFSPLLGESPPRGASKSEICPPRMAGIKQLYSPVIGST